MAWKSVVAACGLSLAGLLSASAQEGYLEWADANGLVGVFAEPDADLDTDGITNLMAYAFDLAPMNDAEAWDKLPSLAFVGDPPEPVMIFVMPPEIPRDVSYVVDLVLDDGKRVEIARKNGRGAWGAAGRSPGGSLTTVAPKSWCRSRWTWRFPRAGSPSKLRVEFLP